MLIFGLYLLNSGFLIRKADCFLNAECYILDTECGTLNAVYGKLRTAL